MRKMQKEEELPIPDVMPEPIPNNRPGKNPLVLKSQDFWFKIFGMLNQLWALIEEDPESGHVVVYWIDDNSGVRKKREFPTAQAAEMFLLEDGYRLYSQDRRAWAFLIPPGNPYNN